MVTTMRHLFAALLLLTAIGSAEAQTWGSSTVETSAANLTNVSNVFTPACPTLGGGFAIDNVVVTATSQTIALPVSCPSSSVGLFVTFNICNGLGGTAPCNGIASGPFSPGISFGSGFEFPSSPGPYTATPTGGAKDIVTCEIAGTAGPWICGTPQYAVVPVTPGFAFINQASCVSAGGPVCTTPAVNMSGANLLVGAVSIFNGGGQTITTITDSVGSNTYTKQLTSADGTLACFYVFNPTVNSSMTFSETVTSPPAFPYLGVAGFSGAVSAPFDQSNMNSNASTASLATGSVTPSQANELVVACLGLNATATGISVNSGYTLEGARPPVGSNNNGGALAFLIQGAAAATNPTFSWTTSVIANAGIMSFK